MTKTLTTEAAKHTPGPWRAEPNPPNTKQWIVIASTHETVVHSVAGGKDHAEANARLIAAAPDLLELVKLALRNEESRLYMLPASDDEEVSAQKDILSAAIGRYRAAIAKAEPR